MVLGSAAHAPGSLAPVALAAIGWLCGAFWPTPAPPVPTFVAHTCECVCEVVDNRTSARVEVAPRFVFEVAFVGGSGLVALSFLAGWCCARRSGPRPAAVKGYVPGKGTRGVALRIEG